MSEQFKYWAFISYSHQDKAWGDWLHKALETYRVPKRLAGRRSRDGTVPKRLYPIFRDREELPTSSDLGSNINESLKASRYLIVICSPKSAVSRWVNEEVKAFKALGAGRSHPLRHRRWRAERFRQAQLRAAGVFPRSGALSG